MHTPGKEMTGVVGDAHVSANSRGIRGTEMPTREHAYRILCLGGSTTACQYLDDGESWPSLLMEHLNRTQSASRVWIGSAGKPGYSTIEHLKFVTESGLMNEIDSVALLVGLHDLERTLGKAADASSAPVPAWRKLCLFDWLFCPAMANDDSEGSFESPDFAPALSEYSDRIAAVIHAPANRGACVRSSSLSRSIVLGRHRQAPVAGATGNRAGPRAI